MVSQFHRYLFSLKNRFTSPAKVIAGRGFSNNLKGGSGSRSSIFMKLLQELPGGYDSLSRENARQAGDMSVRPLNQVELESYLRAWLLSVGVNSDNMNLAQMKYEMGNIGEFLAELKAHYRMGNFSGDDMARVIRLIQEGSETEARLQRRIAELEAQKAQYVRIAESLTRQLASTASPQEASKIASDLEQIKAETTKLEGDKDESMLHLRNPKLDTLDQEIKNYVLSILRKLNEEDPMAYLQNTLTSFLSKIDSALDLRASSEDLSKIEEGLTIFRKQLQEYLDILKKDPTTTDLGFILRHQFDDTNSPVINNLMLEIASIIQQIIKTKDEVSPNISRLREMLIQKGFTAPEDDVAFIDYLHDNILEEYVKQKQRILELEAQVRGFSSDIVEKQTEISNLKAENEAYRSAVIKWITQLSGAKNTYDGVSLTILMDNLNDLIRQMGTKSEIMSESDGRPEPTVRDAIAVFMQQIIGAFKNYADGIASLSNLASTVPVGITKPEMAKKYSAALYNDIRIIQNLPAVVPLVNLYPNFGLDLSKWLEQIQGIVENYNSMLDKSVKFYSVIESIAGLLRQPVLQDMEPIIAGVKALQRNSDQMYQAQMQQLKDSIAQLQKENETMASSLSAYTSMGDVQKIQQDLNRNAQQISRISQLEEEISRLQSELKSAESTVQRLTPTSSSIPPVPPPTPYNSTMFSESTIGPPPSEPLSTYSIPSVPPPLPSVPPPPLPSGSSEMGDAEIASGYKTDIGLGVQALAESTGHKFLENLRELRELMADIYRSTNLSSKEKAVLANYLNVEIVRVLLYPKRIWAYSSDNRLATRRYYIMLPILSRVGLAAAYNYMIEHPNDKLTLDLYEGYGKVILGALRKVIFSLTALSRIPFNDALYTGPNDIFTIYNKEVEREADDAREFSLGSGALTTREQTPDALRRVFNTTYAAELQHPRFNIDLMDWISTLIFWCRQKMKRPGFWDPKYLPIVRESCGTIDEATVSVLTKPDNMKVMVRNVLNPFEVNKKKIPYGFFSPDYWDPSYKTIADYYKI